VELFLRVDNDRRVRKAISKDRRGGRRESCRERLSVPCEPTMMRKHPILEAGKLPC
jgi:hypothetical protein